MPPTALMRAIWTDTSKLSTLVGSMLNEYCA